MRVVLQEPSPRGSLRWIRTAIALRPDLLQPASLPEIRWVSPVAEDDYAEYRDAAFLDRLGLGRLGAELAEFWPARGPQWDALGLTEAGPVLVEAKAHISEMRSPPSKASRFSRRQIDQALEMVRADLGVSSGASWSERYYQYANRLAHLWWLRRCGVDAKLLLVSFLGDPDLRGPEYPERWLGTFAKAERMLGLPSDHKLRPHILHVMPHVRDLAGPAARDAHEECIADAPAYEVRRRAR